MKCITDRHVATIANGAKLLQKINLHATDTGDEALLAIARHCGPSLTHLDISTCYSDHDTDGYGKGTLFNSRWLGVEDSDQQRIVDGEINYERPVDAGLQAVAIACKHRLRYLNTHARHQLTDESLAALAENCQQLVHLGEMRALCVQASVQPCVWL